MSPLLARARSGKVDLATLLAEVEQAKAQFGAPAAVALYRAWLESTRSPLACVAWFNLGVELSATGDLPGAEAAYRSAVAAKSDLIEARLNLGSVMEQQGRIDEALQTWRDALKLLPDTPGPRANLSVAALNNLGRVLETRKQYADAVGFLARSLELDPNQPDAMQHWLHLRQRQANWPVEQPLKGMTRHQMRMAMSPLAMLAAHDDPAQHTLTSRNFVARKFGTLPAANLAAARPPRAPGRKLRIGYLSGDLCTHAVGLLLPDFLESHDRSRVEIHGFCWSLEDGSDTRRRLVAAFDRYHRIAGVDDLTAAKMIADAGIDVLVDLHGLSSGVRPGILAQRPAPVQVTWLGFIGPTALPWIDYVIADAVALPESLEPLYGEKVLRVDGSFLPGDRKRRVGRTPTRAEIGLPEDAFVFASFNNAYKLNPVMWDCWMRILRRVERSVLWIVDDNPWCTANLKRAARAVGIDEERLVFTGRTGHADFLGRMPLADLMLDNHPYNAGSTGNDALWMGLPVLAMAGKCFVTRMGASMLTAAGLPELITHDLVDYENTAVSLAGDATRLRALRERLARARTESPLFDMPRLARSVETLLEGAYHHATR